MSKWTPRSNRGKSAIPILGRYRALVAECGADVSSIHRTSDDAAEVEATVREALRGADVVVSSGGVSAGDFDPMRDVLLQHADVHFWKVNMKQASRLCSRHWA